MKSNKNNLITVILIFLNNFLGLPMILFNIYKKKESVFLIALFMGILGYYFTPSNADYDIARYYSMFSDKTLRENTFMYQKDIYAEILINFLIKYDLSKNLLGFSSAFISYYFLMKSLFIVMKQKNIENKKYFMFFSLFFISIPIIEYTGIRFLPAVSLFVYSIILKNKKNKKIYIIFMISSIFFHSSMVLLIFLFLINEIIEQKIDIKIYKLFFFISLFLGIILNADILGNIIKLINELGYIYLSPAYITGKWGEGYLKRLKMLEGLYYYRQMVLLSLKKIVIVAYFLLIKKNNKKIDKYICMLGILCMSISLFQTPFERYFRVFFFLTIIFNVSNKLLNKKYKENNIFYLIVFCYSILILLFDVRDHYYSLFISYSNIVKISLINMLYQVFN